MEPQNPEGEILQLRSQVAQLQQTVTTQRTELDALRSSSTPNTTCAVCGSNGSVINPKPPLLWRGCPSLQCGVVRPHVVTLGEEVYVGGGNTASLEMSRRVYKFTREAEKWESLPITPHLTFALTLVKGSVTVVGGVNVLSSLTCGDLLNFDGISRKWKKNFPAMPTKRCAASATSNGSFAVVIGGIHEDGRSYLNTVEVLDMSIMKWSTADPLPKPTTFMCITTCDKTDRIYLVGGLTKQGAIRSIFSCFFTDLVQSSSTASAASASVATKPKQSVWGEIAQAPYYRMGCIALGGKLVVASGLSDRDRVTSTVHVYDSIAQQWSVVGEMAASRSSCSLASLGEGQLMVVGGYVNPRNWMSSLTTDVMECVNLQLN